MGRERKQTNFRLKWINQNISYDNERLKNMSFSSYCFC